jgi:hypothetical protein
MSKQIRLAHLSQSFFAGVIFASFLLSIISAEMKPPRNEELLGENQGLERIFMILDDVITGLFATELLINMVAHWFPIRGHIPTFFYDPWHVFDLVSTSARYPPPHMTCMYPPPHMTCMCLTWCQLLPASFRL